MEIGEFRQILEETGMSVKKEVERTALVRKMDCFTPDDAAFINGHTDVVGFVAASSVERLAFERPLTQLTRQFKQIRVKRKI